MIHAISNAQDESRTPLADQGKSRTLLAAFCVSRHLSCFRDSKTRTFVRSEDSERPSPANTPIVWLLARLTWVAHCGWNNIQVNNIIHIANRFPLYWIYYCFRSTACCKLQYFFCLESITMCFMLALPLPGNPCKTNWSFETWSNCRFMSLSYLFLLDANPWYYNDVIMSKIASQITGVSIVYLTVSSGAHQRKYPRHWPLSGEFTGDRWLVGKHVVAIKHQSPRDALYLKKLAEWPRGLVGHG